MLKYEVKSVWEQTDAKKQNSCMICKKYMKFISENKTERECVAAALKRLREAGFCSDFETGNTLRSCIIRACSQSGKARKT